MRGINAAYDEVETRGWLRFRMLALAFTAGLAAFVIVSVAVITLLPTLLKYVGLGGVAQDVFSALRWPALAMATMLGLGVLYRYAPNRTPAKWSWVTAGSLLATLIWIAASLAFSVYAENFGSYNKTYGTLGGAVVLGLWMYISALAILLGAELNAELEHQTREDSTIGPPRPMGQRGAQMADDLGKARPEPNPPGATHETWFDRLAALNRGRRHKQ
jgi:membrane protein